MCVDLEFDDDGGGCRLGNLDVGYKSGNWIGFFREFLIVSGENFVMKMMEWICNFIYLFLNW